MRLLTLSDIESPFIYNNRIRKRFADVSVAISCGDLKVYYLEYVISMLNIPLYYVLGNHASEEEIGASEPRLNPWGAINLHKKSIFDKKYKLVLAGIEGSLRYNEGRHQYSQREMWRMVLGLVPKFILNKARFGRYLDIFVTHASPWKVHDDTDRAHQGIKAFLWLDKIFQPQLHLHGHIHLYNRYQPYQTLLGKTRIINTYGFRELDFPFK